MIIALAQINATIGDFAGNIAKIRDAADRARRLSARLCLFPEQCIPGYPAQDLLERPQFIRGNLAALDDLTRAISGIAVVVGFAEPHERGVGKGLYNSAALIDDGRLVSVHRKSLLPTYDVFDEARYFDSAPAVTVAELDGIKLGVTICEDVWNDPDFWQRRLYPIDPGAELARQGAQIIINIAASPFTIYKRRLRREMLASFANHHQLPLLFVNLIGGNDDLVFDGASLALKADGTSVAVGAEFEEDLILIEHKELTASRRPLTRIIKPKTTIDFESATDDEDIAAALKALTLGTRDYAHKCGFTKGLLGLSGGIDSALVAAIGAVALGPENIEGWLMPSRYSSEASVADALELARNLGIAHRIVPINDIHDAFLKTIEPHLGSDLGLTEENIQARIRGTLLMAQSNHSGCLLLTTGNKSEFATGYCTLYGDMAGGLAVLSDVPKTMVYRLARLINQKQKVIPQAIMDKAPSAELRPNQKDSDSLPPYDQLDPLLEDHIVNGMDGDALVAAGWDAAMVERVLTMVRRTEYKRRQAPPGIKITTKSFGFGRRMPLSARWMP